MRPTALELDENVAPHRRRRHIQLLDRQAIARVRRCVRCTGHRDGRRHHAATIIAAAIRAPRGLRMRVQGPNSGGFRACSLLIHIEERTYRVSGDLHDVDRRISIGITHRRQDVARRRPRSAIRRRRTIY
jgi:hypothetical protein